MSHIVERLRKPIDPDDPNLWKIDEDRREAADEIERLKEALASYACPGIGKCREERLNDGTCIHELSGQCGDEARRALEEK